MARAFRSAAIRRAIFCGWAVLHPFGTRAPVRDPPGAQRVHCWADEASESAQRSTAYLDTRENTDGAFWSPIIDRVYCVAVTNLPAIPLGTPLLRDVSLC